MFTNGDDIADALEFKTAADPNTWMPTWMRSILGIGLKIIRNDKVKGGPSAFTLALRPDLAAMKFH